MSAHTIATYQSVQSTPGMGCGAPSSVVAVESSKNDIKTQIGFDNYKHSLQSNTNK